MTRSSCSFCICSSSRFWRERQKPALKSRSLMVGFLEEELTYLHQPFFASGRTFQTMRARTIAIGDIHGCTEALAAVLAAIKPAEKDTLVFLGDYVDRGPDSRGVIEQILSLETKCRVVPLLGN